MITTQDKLKPAARSTSLTEAAYERLRADIIGCRLSPGTKLRINELCERLEVSLGAVREALSRLAAEGFVLSEAQRGFQVAPVSGADLADLTTTRIEVENLALRRAMAAGDVRWEAEVVAAFHHLSRVPERDPADPTRLNDEWVWTHAAFHSALVAACDSAWIKRMRDMLYAQSERYRRLSVLTRDVGRAGRDALSEHRSIMDAVLARSAEDACRLMAEHLTKTTEILLQAGLADDTQPVKRKDPRSPPRSQRLVEARPARTRAPSTAEALLSTPEQKPSSAKTSRDKLPAPTVTPKRPRA